MNNMTTKFHFMFQGNAGDGYYIAQIADTYEEAVNKALAVLKLDVGSYTIECIGKHEVAKTHFLSGSIESSAEELTNQLEGLE